ncbi:hypothetical protein [Maricaulis sp.]|uniref:ImuA family protein n=1 Tax=Maricaulis sp. TaxID=1486257 RepID=UPI002614CC73|nr:hypothetical protein [Maricaulis sp.]
MRSASSRPDGPAQLEKLRAKIRDLMPASALTMATEDAHAPAAQDPALAAGPLLEVDRQLHLGTGLHEFCPQDYLDTPAALAVQSGFMAQALRRAGTAPPLLWVRARNSGQDFGQPYPLGLQQWGLAPERTIFAETDSLTDALWAMEDALRAGAWVMGEAGTSSRYDLTATKRLHMAAQARGGLALVLRHHDMIGASAALTRWRLSARPSPAQDWRGATGLPGLGSPRFRAHLERVRGGPPKQFDIEWKHAAFHVLEPAPLADRTARPEPRSKPARQRA